MTYAIIDRRPAAMRRENTHRGDTARKAPPSQPPAWLRRGAPA